MKNPEPKEPTPLDEEFKKIVAPIKKEVIRAIMDTSLVDTQKLESNNHAEVDEQELEGVDKTMYQIGILGEGDRSVSLVGFAHEAMVRHQLLPQLETVIPGEDEPTKILRKRLQITHLQSVDLTREHERIPALKNYIATLYSQIMDFEDDHLPPKIDGVYVHEKELIEDLTTRQLRIELQSNEVNGETPQYIVIQCSSHNNIIIRIEPDASEVYRNGKVTPIPSVMNLGGRRGGDASYCITMCPSQLYVDEYETGNPADWTSEYVLDFIQKNIADRLQDYANELKNERLKCQKN